MSRKTHHNGTPDNVDFSFLRRKTENEVSNRSLMQVNMEGGSCRGLLFTCKVNIVALLLFITLFITKCSSSSGA